MKTLAPASRPLLLALLLAAGPAGWTVPARAEEADPGAPAAREVQAAAREAQPAAGIEDNSFFIEEAYNQEEGVVQHISNLWLVRGSAYYTFTQEWPVGSERHQLSYTLPYTWLGHNAGHGVGDVLLNYRYQLAPHDAWAAVSPRLSVIFPTGRDEAGLGVGSVGLQLSLPASRRVSRTLAAHANAGATVWPHARGVNASGAEERGNLVSYNLGASLVWPVPATANLMLEYVLTSSAAFDGAGEVTHTTQHIVSPGVRVAVNLGSLQIVPGLAAPVVLGQDAPHFGVFAYLSFEHPFKHVAEAVPEGSR